MATLFSDFLWLALLVTSQWRAINLKTVIVVSESFLIISPLGITQIFEDLNQYHVLHEDKNARQLQQK